MSETRREDCLVQDVRRANLIYVKEKNLTRPREEMTRTTCSKGSIPDTEDPYLKMEKTKLPKTRKTKRRERLGRSTESPINVGELHLDPRMKNRFSSMHDLDSERMIQHHSAYKTRNHCLAFSLSGPVLPLDEVFPISTSPDLMYGASFTRIQKLPAIQTRTRRQEQDSMADPPSPELKVRTFLPVLQEQPPFSVALSDSLSCLSQSAPPCHYHASPLVSARPKSHSVLFMDPPCASSSLTSETSLFSSSPTRNTACSSLSSSSSLGPIPSQLFQKVEPHLLFPAPPARPANEKERNHRQRQRPGRRVVPLNKIDVAPNHKAEEDIQLEMADIEKVDLEKIEKKPSVNEETVSDKERRKIEEYQRLNPNRRKGICEELENDCNVMKINGQRYNLTMLRHELIQMSKAVTKYNKFRLKILSFIDKDRP